MDEINCKLKILHKYIKTNTSAMWQHILHSTRLLTAQTKTKKDKSPQKCLPFENGSLGKKISGEWAKSRKG